MPARVARGTEEGCEAARDGARFSQTFTLMFADDVAAGGRSAAKRRAEPVATGKVWEAIREYLPRHSIDDVRWCTGEISRPYTLSALSTCRLKKKKSREHNSE